MATRKGANPQKADKTICMVKDCQRVALYKNPAKKAQGGYCAKHRAFAAPGRRAGEDNFAAWVKDREARKR